jgi:hypothetical protein
VLWTYYRAVKGREGAPASPTTSPARPPVTKKSAIAKKPARQRETLTRPDKTTIKKIIKTKLATQRREKTDVR